MPERTFISYKYTGTTEAEREALLTPLVTRYQEQGKNFFCNYREGPRYEEEKLTTKQIMDECFRELGKSTHQLVLVHHAEQSQGVILEMGYALAMGLRITLAIHRPHLESLNTMRTVAHRVLIYDSVEDLLTQLFPPPPPEVSEPQPSDSASATTPTPKTTAPSSGV